MSSAPPMPEETGETAPDTDLFGGKAWAARDLSALELAELFGVSDRTIRDLVARSIISKTPRGTFSLRDVVPAYTHHLREIAASRGHGAGNSSLTDARERQAREKADQLALRNGQIRGELIPAGQVEARWISITSAIRARLLAIPSRMATLSPLDTAALSTEIRAALTELACDDAPTA